MVLNIFLMSFQRVRAWERVVLDNNTVVFIPSFTRNGQQRPPLPFDPVRDDTDSPPDEATSPTQLEKLLLVGYKYSGNNKTNLCIVIHLPAYLSTTPAGGPRQKCLLMINWVLSHCTTHALLVGRLTRSSLRIVWHQPPEHCPELFPIVSMFPATRHYSTELL